MTELENRFFEEYKRLDLLIKKKLGKEDGVSGYIDDIIRRYGTMPNDSSCRQMLKNLKHIRWVRNNIAHSEEDSECKESDITIANYYYNLICNDEDPLAKVVVQQPVKQKQVTNTVNKSVSSSKTKESFMTQRKYNILKIFIRILTILIIVLYIIPLFCVYLTSKFNLVEWEEEKKKAKKVGYAGTKYSYFYKDAWPEGSEEAKEVFENIAGFFTKQDMAKYLKPFVSEITNSDEVTKILKEKFYIDVEEKNIDVDKLVNELNNQE
jgi:hypothetical protein